MPPWDLLKTMKDGVKAIRDDALGKREKKYPDPFFIDEYREGFNIGNKEASLNAANARLIEIKDEIESERASFSLGEGRDTGFDRKLANIEDVLLQVSILKEKLIRPNVSNDDMGVAVDGFMKMLETILWDFSIEDAASHRAAKALADVLEITRKSIPDIPKLINSKNWIAGMRDGLGDNIRAYDASLTKGRDTESPTTTEPESDPGSDDEADYKGPGGGPS